MLSLFADTVESAPRLGAMSNPDSAIAEPSSLMANLPLGYVMRRFTTFKQLQIDTSNILKVLQDNEENGNQYLVLLGLSKRGIERLDNQGLSGLDYRFQWEGTVGLIKVVPSHAHNATTDQVTRTIDDIYPAFWMTMSRSALSPCFTLAAASAILRSLVTSR